MLLYIPYTLLEIGTDMAEDAAALEDDDGQKKSGGMVKTIMMGVGIFVIVLVAQTIAPMISNMLGLAPPVVVQGEATDEDGEGADGEVASAAPIYWPLKPAMVVNYSGAGESSFLQVEMEVMARDQMVIDQVKEHTPVLRNSLLFLLARQTDETVFSTDGKQNLLNEALAQINQVLEPYLDGKSVEAVYFTSFVAQ